MFKFSDQPLEFAELLQASFAAYKQAFKQIILWGICLGLIKVLIHFLAPDNGHIQIVDLSQPQHFYGMFILVMFIALLLNSFCIIGLNYQLFNNMIASHKSFLQALLIAVTRGWKAFASCLLLGVFVVLMVVIAIFLSHLLSFVAWLLLLIAVVYIWVSVFAWLPLIAIENLSSMAAAKASFALVRRHWWETLGVLVLSTAIFAAVMFVLVLIFTGISSLIAGASLATTMWGSLAAEVLGSIFVLPWMFCLYIVLIHNLRLKHEQDNDIDKVLEKTDV